MRYGYNIQTWGSLMAHPLGVGSVKDCVYSARVPNLKPVLQEIAQAGYEGFEMFDGDLLVYEKNPQELRGLMEEVGLKLSGVYSGGNFIFSEILPEELFKIRKVAELASKVGAEFLVVGGGAIPSRGVRNEDYRRLGEALNEVQKIAADHGLRSTYHPHLGTCCENWAQLKMVMEHTTIGLCPDTAHVVAGGINLGDLVNFFGDRINYVHLKDYKDGNFLELGDGIVDFQVFMRLLRRRGYDGWIIVELDATTHTPTESLRRNTRYLKKLLEEL
jgi:inosose dehydratase